jgi:hypothetical protein
LGYAPFVNLIVVDVESDGPIPGEYSMVCFGAVVVEPLLKKTFYGRVRPITDRYLDEALRVSGFTRAQHLGFDEPDAVMEQFSHWLSAIAKKRPVFISDNLAFDWQFINYYFHHFTGRNPFGFSGRRIGDLYCGLTRDMGKATEWKRFRRTPHTHHPVDDAKGNAEALLHFETLGLKMPA